MTRQTWTAAVSAVLFVLAAAIIALVPVPFVTIAPGATHNLLGTIDTTPVVEVEGMQSFPTTGQLLLTTVEISPAEAPVSLPEAAYAYWAESREVVPHEAIYSTGTSVEELTARWDQQMATARINASAAGLRAAGVDVQQVPMVQSIASTGPAVDRLFPGDFVLGVDGVSTPTVADVRARVEDRAVGAPVTFTVLRERERLEVTVTTVGSNTQVGLPVWGGTLTMGYSYTPTVDLTIDPSVIGDSAGLMMALAVFDRVTADDLMGDRVVAGTGVIDGAGTVTTVWGVQEKMAAAEAAGAEIFLLPTANCGDTVGVARGLRVVAVGTLQDAIDALDALADPSMADLVRGCQ